MGIKPHRNSSHSSQNTTLALQQTPASGGGQKNTSVPLISLQRTDVPFAWLPLFLHAMHSLTPPPPSAPPPFPLFPHPTTEENQISHPSQRRGNIRNERRVGDRCAHVQSLALVLNAKDCIMFLLFSLLRLGREMLFFVVPIQFPWCIFHPVSSPQFHPKIEPVARKRSGNHSLYHPSKTSKPCQHASYSCRSQF